MRRAPRPRRDDCPRGFDPIRFMPAETGIKPGRPQWTIRHDFCHRGEAPIGCAGLRGRAVMIARAGLIRSASCQQRLASSPVVRNGQYATISAIEEKLTDISLPRPQIRTLRAV